jgi:hypothetical protein
LQSIQIVDSSFKIRGEMQNLQESKHRHITKLVLD